MTDGVVCPECGESFSSPSARYRHREAIHNPHGREPKSRKKRSVGLPVIISALALALVLFMLLSGRDADPDPSADRVVDSTTTTTAEDELPGVESAAQIAYGTSDPSLTQMADVLAYLQGMVDDCADLAHTGEAADLYAGVLTVAEDESGRTLDPHEVLDGLAEVASVGGNCRDLAAGYATVLIAG